RSADAAWAHSHRRQDRIPRHRRQRPVPHLQSHRDRLSQMRIRPMTTTALWHSDQELFELARRGLFTAVVGDCMDKLGLRRQFLFPQIQPLRQDTVVIGRAMTVLEADVFAESVQGSANPLMHKPFGLMLEALDDLKTNEVYICT